MSDPLLTFNPVFPMAFVIAVVVLLLPFLIYSEVRRQLKFLSWRIVAAGIVIISLLGLLLHPTYPKTKKSDSILLLTKGYQKSKVDSIIQKNPTLKVVSTRNAQPYSNSSVLKSWFELSDESIFCVVGEGIPSYALEALHHKGNQFIPSLLPEGVTRLIIPEIIQVSDRTSIQGTFNAYENRKLKLRGPGGDEDSVTLGQGEADFSLSFTPKQTGNFIYSFVVEDLHGSSSVERLPIVVMPEQPLRILFIQKFPTAEVRHLKNFLSGKNHKVGLRYQVSKNNFTYEYANIPHFRMDRLGSDLLQSFDLLFIDQKSYDELSILEMNDLKKSIANGLGVIFLLHDPKDKVLNEFAPLKSKLSSFDTVHLRLPSRSYVLPVLPIELGTDPSLLAVTKNKNRVLSGYFYWGQGKIGLQFIQETFRLSTEGNTADYASLWAPLIGNTARTKESNFSVKLATPFPYYPDEPIDIAVTSSGLQPSLYADSVRISMMENALMDDYWEGRTWAGPSGWHPFYIQQDSTQGHYFVSDTSEWKSLRIFNQLADNRISGNPSITNANRITQQVPVPAVLFYFLFLFSAAFLWLAPKI